jgi:hypothetical protein
MKNTSQPEIPSLDWSPYPIESYFTQAHTQQNSSRPDSAQLEKDETKANLRMGSKQRLAK